MDFRNKQIMFGVAGVILATALILALNYEREAEPAQVNEDGSVVGSYSIENIMALKKPYVCTFEKVQGANRVAGTVKTDGANIYAEFTIKAEFLQDEFMSYFIVREGKSYAWTSLASKGYISPVAKSATTGASPVNQAQIVGTKDEIPYRCDPWNEPDLSIFEIPSSITFVNFKN
jgi:hypothetical protein